MSNFRSPSNYAYDTHPMAAAPPKEQGERPASTEATHEEAGASPTLPASPTMPASQPGAAEPPGRAFGDQAQDAALDGEAREGDATSKAERSTTAQAHDPGLDMSADAEGMRRFAEEAERESLRAQLRAAQEQVLRGLADMENLRRRTANEVSNAHKYAVESFAESLVPVLDSLELSLKVEKPSVDSLREGAEATLRLLQSAFTRHRLVTIEPLGERFDPNRHQAISMVPGHSVQPPVSPNHVVSVLQKGYLIHDRVLRPALVTVAQA